MAVFVGFVPTLPSILLLFTTTLLGGHLIKKQDPESYEGFIKLFGLGVVVFNLIAVGLIMAATELDYVDRASAAFLNLMVVVVILTLLKIKKNGN